ncbi:very long chain fatty acid elongase 4 isoform X3 [Pogona vitticeps]
MALAWKNTQEFYYWAIENGDPRTDPWPLVYSPVPVILIFILYLIIVAVGPRIMQQRKPVRLKGFLVIYNLSVVLLSVYMFYEFLMTSLLANYSYLCQPVDYSWSDLGMRQMAGVCWWFFFSKVIELLDTVFFILRKKNDQVTFLHVYHHGTMLFNWWAGVKYVPGGQEYIMRKAELGEFQTGIKISERNINNLRYADDMILMAESEEELRNLLMRVKEESAKNGLKLNIKKKPGKQKGKIWSHHFCFLGLHDHCRWGQQP